ncbi:putative e3 ubiquitin-protein ligase hula [Erysiphe neolycopersici]|uniref:Putative e3 ubiquitin-protein ligase hula n=1 Tax=Erysiphe neolycopersici TaxID=212602 RepID=A0A420HEG9_9PEZI|nr:putative e3 ubiquitin-protein ligase hula [Erysiphe neolycopersici]
MVETSTCVLETCTGATGKRKRGFSEEKCFSMTFGLHDSKRHRSFGNLISPVSPLDIKLDDMANEIEPISETNLIANTIESQFSLEILLKHQELRLIDQELAKCQIALEQIRRCHLIPYPGNLETPEARLNISDGTCPFYQENNPATWAPPFGVTDGPYSRHYAKWLIPDTSFDGVAWQNVNLSCKAEPMSTAQSVRKNHTESIAKVGLRGKTSQKHHTLSSGYTQTREKVGPCILKRGDGQTVKLVCLDCDREDFLSTQGFINHCRIAHQRDFKSHVEAANASGKFVKIDETGCLIGNDNDPKMVSDLVHPLIRNAPTGMEAREACKALLARLADSKAMFREGRLPGFSSLPKFEGPSHSMPNILFPSSSKSHLSELLHRKGLPNNLDKIIEEFHQQIDIEDLPVEELYGSKKPDAIINIRPHDSHELYTSTLVPRNPISKPANVDLTSNSRASDKSAKYIKEKGNLEERLQKFSSCNPSVTIVSPEKVPNTPPWHHFSASGYQDDHIIELDLINRRHESSSVSPHTINSYNAPSLVSDDGDYDEDAIESERSENGVNVNDVADIDIEEDMGPSCELRSREDSDNMGRLTRKESIRMSDL